MRLVNDFKDKFTMIPNYILQQRNISLKAIGVYCKLASFPTDWKFTEEGLVAIVKDGRDAVRTALKELEDLNLFYRFREREENGTLGETIFYISPIPMSEENKKEIQGRYSPLVALTINNKSEEKPMLENPMLDKPEQYNNNIYNTKDIYIKNTKKENYDEMFEQFYKAYPKKVSKANTKKWFEKNKPSEQTFKQIMEALEKHKKQVNWNKDNGQFIPHPSTWLNQSRWEDELDVQTSVTDSYANYQYTDEQLEVMRRLAED